MRIVVVESFTRVYYYYYTAVPPILHYELFYYYISSRPGFVVVYCAVYAVTYITTTRARV